jgi:hypothetical protein
VNFCLELFLRRTIKSFLRIDCNKLTGSFKNQSAIQIFNLRLVYEK